jgi:DNA polymerase III epsilon subunit-like protein
MQVEDIPQKTFFVYDLEFIGDVSNPHTCQIWDLAFYCVTTREMFRAVVDPNPLAMFFPPPPTPECMQLTREFLYRYRAKTFDIVFMKLVRWICNRTKGTPIFISHNNFRADKPVLMYEIMRHNLMMPPTWYFFDSLLYIRDNFREFDEYNMDYLVRNVLNSSTRNAHRASVDTLHLHKILQHLSHNYNTICGEIQSAQYTSLRTIPGIGRSVQSHFFRAGLYNVEMVREAVRCLYVQGAQTGCNVNVLIRNWLGRILHDMPSDSRLRIQRSIST